MSERLNELDQPIGFAVPDWKPVEKPSHTSLEGRLVRLVAPDVKAHAADLFAAFAMDESHHNWTYLPYGPFANLAEFSAWMEKTCLGQDPLFYVIWDKQTQKPIGLASYLRIDPTAGVIEVGHIHFSPALQRTAHATETMFLMMARVFDELGYRRYEWKCDALNAPSRKAAARLGFQFEGIFRQATIYKGRNRDTAWFSIIDQEWPGLRKAFETYLADDNFTPAGLQIRSLQDIRQN